ncbi:unnamed protein product [Auanema sp. JU1783]|nr:unnamed protein product [Auanema sp. JU1783]
MSFKFSHTFENPFDDTTDSLQHIDSKITWHIRLDVLDEIRFILIGSPLPKFVRPDVKWGIRANVTCNIGSKEPIVIENADIHSEGYNEVSGACLYQQWKEDLLNNTEIVQDGHITVTVVISDIIIRDIRIFEMEDKRSLNAVEADLTIHIGDEYLYCHSQMLALNSVVFKKIIDESGDGLHIHLEDEVPINEFRELLHHTYYPIETIDDYNWRILLCWATKFEVIQVLYVCQNVMTSLVKCSSTDKKIDIFLFSWKFDVEPLKAECLNDIFSTDGEHSILMKTNIVQNTVYQEMEDKRKLNMLEFLIDKLDLRCHTV